MNVYQVSRARGYPDDGIVCTGATPQEAMDLAAEVGLTPHMYLIEVPVPSKMDPVKCDEHSVAFTIRVFNGSRDVPEWHIVKGGPAEAHAPVVDHGKVEAAARQMRVDIHSKWGFGDVVDEYDMEVWDDTLSEALGEEPYEHT